VRERTRILGNVRRALAWDGITLLVQEDEGS